MLKNISRTAVDRYLKVVRTPVDAVLSRSESERTKALGLKLDRADAAARNAAGSALRDETLKDDARARREAADERERALRLRGVATEHVETADAKADDAEQEAERKRRDAAKAAERKKQQAKKRREAAKEKAAKQAAERKRSAAKEASEAKADAAKQGKREKLAQLEAKEAALAKKEEALTAAAESKRLEDAAAEAKSARKNGS